MKRELSTIGGLVVCCAVVVAMIAAQASAVPVVEVTVETDKAVYNLGETCIITCTLYNPTDESAQVDAFYGAVDLYAFENAAYWDRLYLLENEEPLWYLGLFIFPFGGSFLVNSGESYHESLNWYLPIDAALLGEYEFVAVTGPADGQTVIDFTNASAHIAVVPEPTTLCFLFGVAVAVVSRKGNRRRRR